MERLEKHIVTLLQRHDCVIVPDFGGFILNSQPARFGSRLELRPPSKVISFNVFLKMNDGLLLDQIARTEDKTFEQAQEYTRQEVENWKAELDNGKQLILQGIGKISVSPESKLLFDPSYKYNFLRSSFGLPALQIIPVDASKNPMHEDYKKKKLQPRTEQTEPQQVEEMFRRNLWQRTGVAAAILVIAIFSAFLAYNKIYMPGEQEASFEPASRNIKLTEQAAPEADAPKTLTESKTAAIPPSIKADIAATDKQQSPEHSSETILVAPAQPVTSPVAIKKAEAGNEFSAKGKFYVIGGSFTTSKGAQRLISQFEKKGFKPELIHNETAKYRVAYKAGSDSVAAEKYLREIRVDENKSAWLLKW